MKKNTYKITKKGLEELKAEFKKRSEVTKKRLQDQLDQELGEGDISENSNYYKVQEDIASNDKRISELEEIIDHSVLIDTDACNRGNCKISAGMTVKLAKDGEDIVYTIVGATESNPAEKRISIESPLGQAIKGKKQGDDVVINTPLGEQEYKIVEVS
ncbi:MAG: GreA/GreB family elongation factor [bacterium]